MSWILPTPLLLFASTVTPLPLASLVRRPRSGPRLIVEVFVTALAVRTLTRAAAGEAE